MAVAVAENDGRTRKCLSRWNSFDRERQIQHKMVKRKLLIASSYLHGWRRLLFFLRGLFFASFGRHGMLLLRNSVLSAYRIFFLMMECLDDMDGMSERGRVRGRVSEQVQ